MEDRVCKMVNRSEGPVISVEEMKEINLGVQGGQQPEGCILQKREDKSNDNF